MNIQIGKLYRVMLQGKYSDPDTSADLSLPEETGTVFVPPNTLIVVLGQSDYKGWSHSDTVGTRFRVLLPTGTLCYIHEDHMIPLK